MQMNDCAIIIPVYNVGKQLQRCLDSLVAQTVCPKYILLIDDGSTDESSLICDKYATNYSHIFAFHKANGGVSSARNMGLEIVTEHIYNNQLISCTSKLYKSKYPPPMEVELILFVDPDDWVDKSYVEKLTENMSEADICICGYQRVIYDNSFMWERMFSAPFFSNGENFTRQLVSLHKKTLLFMVWNKCFHSSIIYINHLRFPDVKRLEDACFVYQYLRHCHKINISKNELYNYVLYGQNRKSATTSFGGELCKGPFLLYKFAALLLDHCNELNNPTEDIELFSKRVGHHLESSVWGELVNNLPISKLSFRERKKYIEELLAKYYTIIENSIKGQCNSFDSLTNFVRFLGRHKCFHTISALSYLIPIGKKINRILHNNR